MGDRILIIDSDEKYRSICKDALTREGYEVLEADSGIKGLIILGEESVDLVILEPKLRFEIGLSTLKEIVRKHSKTPVIINSEYLYFQDDWTSWFAKSYLLKSDSLKELLSEIEEVLSRKEKYLFH